MPKWILLLICLIALAGCKTPVVGMQQHPSFTYEAVSQNRFLIGGVVSAIVPLDARTITRFSDLMQRSFIEERPHLDILRTGILRRAIGSESYHHMLDQVAIAGLPDAGDFSAIRRAFPELRYLIVARIEENHISQRNNQSETDVADSEDDQKKGEYEQVRVDVSLITGRKMGVTLSIYDLDTALAVWSGYISISHENSNDSSRTFNKENRWREELIDAFVDGLTGLDSNSYPDAPTREAVLADIFEGFAENMPEPPKKH